MHDINRPISITQNSIQMMNGLFQLLTDRHKQIPNVESGKPPTPLFVNFPTSHKSN